MGYLCFGFDVFLDVARQPLGVFPDCAQVVQQSQSVAPHADV